MGAGILPTLFFLHLKSSLATRLRPQLSWLFTLITKGGERSHALGVTLSFHRIPPVHQQGSRLAITLRKDRVSTNKRSKVNMNSSAI